MVTTQKFGPSWNEIAENDWSFGEQEIDQTERGEFIRLGCDILNALKQLSACGDGLVDESRKRRNFTHFDQVEILLIAADAIGYRFSERMDKFIAHPVIKNTIPTPLSKRPKIISELRKRRGIHAHNFDKRLVDTSSSIMLFSLLARAPEDERDIVKKLVLTESRRIFRKRISEQILQLQQIEDAAFQWANDVFCASKTQWSRFLKSS